MYSGLWLKEFKEKKMFFIAGLILCILPLVLFLSFKALGLFSSNEYLFDAIRLVVFLLILTFFPIFLTVSAFSGEFQKRTMSCLLSFPVSRIRIWFAKILTVVLFLLFIIFIYILLNFRALSSGDKIFLWSALELTELLQIFIMIAFSTMSVTAFISLFFDKESVAVLASVFLSMVNCIILLLMMFVLYWDIFMYPTSFLILLFGLSLVYLASSMVIFNRGELFYQSSLRLKYGLISLIVGLLCFTVLACLLYGRDINIKENEVKLVRNVSSLGNNRLAFLVDGGAWQDGRIWILNKKEGKLTKIKDRFVYDFVCSSKNNLLVYEKWQFSLLHSSKNMEIYLLNLSNFKKRLLLKLDREPGLKINWFDNGEKFLVYSIYYRQEFGTNICDVYVFDKRGELITSSIIVPPYKDLNCKIILVAPAKDKIFVALGSTNSDYKKKDICVLKLQINNKRLDKETVFLLRGKENEGFYMPFNPVSPDGKKLVYFRCLPNVPLDVVLYDFGNKKERNIAKSYYIFPGNLWFSDGRRLLLSSRVEKGQKLLEVNVESAGQKDITEVSDIYSEFSLSPDEKKLVVFNGRGESGGVQVFETFNYKKIFEKPLGEDRFITRYSLFDENHLAVICGPVIELMDIDTKKLKQIFSPEQRR